METLNQINIEEVSTKYDVKLTYHSDTKCQNYDARIEAIEEADGTISLVPYDHSGSFEFVNSDPDRVIAIAQMMLSFAQMVKNNKKAIDSCANS